MSAFPEPVAPYSEPVFGIGHREPEQADVRHPASGLVAVPDVVSDPVPDLVSHLVPAVEVLAHGRIRSAAEVMIAAFALLLALPLLAVTALLIVTTSRGPVFFRQVRVGRGGALFEVVKFRTMYRDAEHRAAALFAQMDDSTGPLNKLHQDPRVTPVGRWLRRLSLDELPQLWNVLTRTMALVGPRPTTPLEVARFAPGDHRRTAVRPGMTGLAQVNGRSDLEWDEAVRLDLAYIEQRSVRLDLAILLRTVPAVFGGRGAY